MIDLEAEILAEVLEETLCEMSIVKGCLIPTSKLRVGAPLFCPQFQIPLVEQNIWKIQQYCDGIRQDIADTIYSLRNSKTFSPLVQAVAAKQALKNQEADILSECESLPKRLTSLKKELKEIKLNLLDVKYYGMKSMLAFQFESEERQEKSRCINLLAYWNKIFLAKAKDHMKKKELAKNDIHKQISELQEKMAQGKRNVDEMGSLLVATKTKINGEVDRLEVIKKEFIEIHEQKMAELRDKRGKIIERTEQVKQQLEEFLDWKSRGIREIPAPLTYKNWLQQSMADNPPPPPKKPKKKLTKKKKAVMKIAQY